MNWNRNQIVAFEKSTVENYCPILQKNTLDLILTDPPYGVLKEERDSISQKTMEEFAQHVENLLKPNGKFVIFCSFPQITIWTEALVKSKLNVQMNPLIVAYKPEGNL